MALRRADHSSRGVLRIGPTNCDVSEWDCEASLMRRPWLTRDCRGMKNKKIANDDLGKATSAAARLLGLRARIPLRACMFVLCVLDV